VKGNKIEQLKLPITARQAQKLLKKGDRPIFVYSDFTGGQEIHLSSLLEQGISETCGGYFRDRSLEAVLASIASRNPDQVVVPGEVDPDDYEDWEDEDYEDEVDDLDPQYAPKETDEVAPQSDTPSGDAEMHGGDNASQEVEDGQSQGGKQPSSTNKAQSQNAGTDEGEDGNGSGLGLTECSPRSNREDSDPESSDRPETGFATSGDAANSGNPQTPSPQKAGTSESDADSESGEGTATSPVREPDGTTRPAESENSRPRDGENEVETQESEFGGQAKSFEDVVDASCGGDEANQGQSGDLEDSWSDLLPEDESNWDDPNSKVDQVSDDTPSHQKKWGESFKKQERESGKLSASANSNFGGINASLSKAGISSKLAKECQRKLAKLIGDATTETSPRRDYQGFCVRLKSFRNPNPARKEESGRPVILIMADVSGSCSSFSDQSVMVAKAASKLGVQGSDVVVLTHSNGYPCELEHNGKAIAVSDIAVRDRRGEHAHENAFWYDALMQKYQVAVAISLGDWDAADDYLRIMLHPNCEKFIWLDNAHCSSRGFVKDESKFAVQGLSRYTNKVNLIRQKLTYKTGCKDAQAFVKEIE
jgi:hypothetical protein